MNFKKSLLGMFTLLTIFNATQSTIMLITVPKSGSHLLIKMVKSLTSQNAFWLPDQELPSLIIKQKQKPIICGHTTFSQDYATIIRKNNVKGFFNIRDPRDQCISRAYWIAKHSPQQDFSALIKKLIIMVPDTYNSQLGWMEQPGIHTVRFERLVGPHGGGSAEAQKNEVATIIKHLGIVVSTPQVEQCIKNLFGNSPTFRNGSIGSWKHHFTEEHKKLFKQHAGQLLINLGYEKDLLW